MSTSGSKSNEHVAHFLVDIHTDHIPKEFNDRSTLWNKVEMAEKNSNAQLARQFIIGLPKELSLSENKNLVESCLLYTSPSPRDD